MSRKPPGKPPSQRGKSGDIDDLWYVAMHLAGQAVAAVVYQVPLIGVDLHRRRLADGLTSIGFTNVNTRIPHEGDRRPAALNRMVVLMAGPMAEVEVNPQYHGCDAHRQNIAQMKAMAAVAICVTEDLGDGTGTISTEEQVSCKPQIDALLLDASGQAAGIVRVYRSAVDEVARLLIERKSLTGSEVGEIVTAHPEWPARIASDIID